jgi:hypothetical protein
MEATADEVKRVLLVLGRTARRIATITRGVEDSRLKKEPDPGSWSVAEILSHLRACADVWGKSIEAMISMENPVLRYVSPRSWIRKTDYAEKDFHMSLRAFASQRTALLKTLRPLAANAWSRVGTFTGTTKGRHQTVFDYALRLAEHELGHIGQMERAMDRTKTP